MAARPPPARPHIGINLSLTAAEWGEDDAWDSASDSESPRQPTTTNSWLPPARPALATTSPKPVPRSSASSSSILALSYTHLNAPSPSSYPPRAEQAQPPKSGWTIVRKSSETQKSAEEREGDKEDDGSGDADDEGEMVVGELEPDIAMEPAPPTIKPTLELGIIRDDVDEIVNGPYEIKCNCLFSSYQ